MGRTVIVVPTYNERGTIATLLQRLAEHASDADVLVVDDASPDGTATVVRDVPGFAATVHLLERSGKNGLGAAYRAGFRWALDRGYDVVVEMDADLSHPVDRLPALLEALADADVAVGSRYVVGGGIENWPWRRRGLSRLGNAYVRWVLGLATRDVTAGFKAFRATALLTIGALESTSSGYSFQVENTWRAERLGLRVVEVPITFTDRTQGESKMSAVIMREALLRPLRWRWQELRAQRTRCRVVEADEARTAI